MEDISNMSFWDKHVLSLKSEISAGLDLSRGKVRLTISYNDSGYTEHLFNKYQDDDLFEMIKDPEYGNPPTIDEYSMSTLRCLDYMRYLERYVDLKEINNVIDFGSGYGNFCRIWKIFNPDVAYYNVDLEEMLEVQRDWIENTVENKEDIHYITHRQLDQVDTNKALFIAAYSLSECSFDVRKEVEVYLKDYDYIIIIYNKMFNNEYDNVKYFNDIQETVLCNHECDVIFNEESSKWWLVCKKK